MKIARNVRPKALIPTASMADIAFLLIIFFMVTTVYDVDRTNVRLPSSNIRVQNEKGSAIVVLHEEKGQIQYKFSDGEKVSYLVSGPQDISLEAGRIVYGDPTRQFVVKADGDLRYELVDEMLDTLRRAGVSNVLLLTVQTGGEIQGA